MGGRKKPRDRGFFGRLKRKKNKQHEDKQKAAYSPPAPEKPPASPKPEVKAAGPASATVSPAREPVPAIPRIKRKPRTNALIYPLMVLIALAGASYMALKARRPPPAPAAALEPMRAAEPAGPLLKSALKGKNQLASRLHKPTLPKRIRGIANPDEEKKDKSYRYDPSLIPPQYDHTGRRIKPTRLRKIHEAGDSGWGYTSPAGFTQTPDTEGLWKSKNAVIRVASAHTSKECLPVCGGKILTVGQLKRSTASGFRTFTFKCGENISLGGETWPRYETTILSLRSSTCVITTFAARSAAARRQAHGDYFIMRRRLAPLPPRPEKPLLDVKGRSKKVRVLR